MDFDPIAKEYLDYGPNAKTEWELGYKRIARMLAPLKGKNILDYGCGPGKFSKYLARLGACVAAVDISNKMIELARIKAPNSIDYRAIRSGDLSFLENDSIDSAVVCFVFCSIENHNEITKILTEIVRVLRPYGKIIIMDANWKAGSGRNFASFRLERHHNLTSGQKVYCWLKGETSFRIEDIYWSKEDCVRMLEATHFQVRNVVEPLASNNEDRWIDETVYSPLIIYEARKI